MFDTRAGLMDEIRDRFFYVDSCPYEGDRIFFENAGGALTLKSVVEVSSKYAALPDNEGRDNPASREISRVISEAKAKAMVFLNASKGQFFVGETGTELLFRMIGNAALGTHQGGNIVGSTLEHPSSRSAAIRWAKLTDKNYIAVPHDSQTGSVSAEDYAKWVTPETRVATVVHTSPVTGMSVELAAISKVIRAISPECFIIVDGIQHAAHGRLDIDSYDVDGYAISPYKIFSRHGYGVTWISDRLSVLPHDKLIGSPEKNWELGTRDVGAYATFAEVINYFEWLGQHFTNSPDLREKVEAAGTAIHAHEKSLTDAMFFGTGNIKGLTDIPEVQIIGGAENQHREGVFSFSMDGFDSTSILTQLRDRGIRVHIRKNDHYSGNILSPLNLPDCIRVSLCHYNSEHEVALFLAAMHEIAASR